MTKQLPKLVLSSSRDIPFSQLVLSQKNVRRLKAGLSIEDLADDIYHRTLLQSLNVRPVVGEDGQETGMFEVPAGGRRFRALELLVKSKRMAKDQPVPCVVREAGIAEEDSLAENVMRVGLHPLDQFRAFTALIDAGLSEDDIAARFFVSVSTVRQRLRLASVAPSLLEVYGEDGMSLEQLMAFTVNEDHARQEQVWEQLSQTYQPSAHQIRRLLTEDAIPASDRRVRFIGLDTYVEAGGYVMRDLFSSDQDGWLQDPSLVEQLVNAKLTTVGEEIGAEGWKWVEAAIDLPYGCERGKRRITGTTIPLTDDEQSKLDALVEEYDGLGEQYQDGGDLPDEVDARLTEIDAGITALTQRPVTYDPEEQARAGVFVSLSHDGRLRIDRGYVRPEDEPASEGADDDESQAAGIASTGPTVSVGGQVQTGEQADDEDDSIRPLPDRLVSELTAERTLALRDALANAPDAAFLALRMCRLAACRSASLRHGLAMPPRTCARRCGASRSSSGTSSGRIGFPANPMSCGWPSRPWPTRSRWCCLPTVCRSASTHCSRRPRATTGGFPRTGLRSGSPPPMLWREWSGSTWPKQAGRRRSTTTSAASPSPGSSRRSAKPRAMPRQY
jgi:ParB family chromosome partitioning protein